MSWGKGITLTILVFVGGMIFLIYKCIGVKYDLVSSNYYQEALDYNSVQEGKSNYSQLNSTVDIQKTEEYIEIHIPNDTDGNVEAVKANLYFPSDKQKDKLVMANSDSILFKRAELAKGFYRVKLSWAADGMPFYYEGSFIN